LDTRGAGIYVRVFVDLRIPSWNQLLPNGPEREHSEKNWAMMLDGLKKTVEQQS